VLSRLDQPAQDRVWVDFKDPGHGTEAEAFGQSRHGPYQLLGFHLLAMQRGAMGLQEMPLAAETHQLAPPSAVGMAVGADIPPAHPAVIRTGGLRAEMPGGIDVPAAASGEKQARWRRIGC